MSDYHLLNPIYEQHIDEDTLDLFIMNRLGPDIDSQVRRHLKLCSACQRQQIAARAIADAVREAFQRVSLIERKPIKQTIRPRSYSRRDSTLRGLGATK